ncbi:MAG: hypothetical protein K2L38_10615, partial [Dysosmobacter sp.]|nr:hypothetical protein [Dysosmobacter sp.]
PRHLHAPFRRPRPWFIRHWAPLSRPPWPRPRRNGVHAPRPRRAGPGRYLALPYDKGKPFPLTTLFCFARLRSIGEETYVVYAFDGQDRPVF